VTPHVPYPEPVDPDSGPAPVPPVRAGAVAVVAAGGAIGSLARWAVGLALPTHRGALPWSTVTVNLVGALLIAVLLVLVTEVLSPHPLLRPFLGVGVLGGFTTFSTAMLDLRTLLAGGESLTALAYLAVTLVGGFAVVAVGLALTRRVAARVLAGAGETG
jgi:CrcB protein